jgi:autotransporter-associated beta strand protein
MVTGNLSNTGVTYGSNVPGTGALATQTINTGFGDSTAGDGTSSGGSELDAAYGVTEGGELYLFFAGNYQDNGNHLNIFLDDGRSGGQNVLNASSASGNLNAMNGSVFSPGFSATYAVDINDYSGTLYVDQYDLTENTANYLGSVALTGGIGNDQNLAGLKVGLNNTNISKMGTANAAANQSDAQAVGTGFELGIPLSELGNPATGSNVEIMADINGGNDSYLSNQFLPGLPNGTANVGGGGTYAGPSSGTFNLSSLSSDWFDVPVGNYPDGTWIATGGGVWQVGNGTPWAAGYVPHVAGDSASFSFATSNSTISLPSTVSVGSLSFSNTNSYTLASTGGSLTMDNGSSSATITDLSGTHFISAPVVLNSNTEVTVANHSDSMVISGNISGNGSLTTATQGGLGTSLSEVILSGSNSYGGGTIITGGNLQLGSSNALPTGTALTLGATDVPAGVLDLNSFNATVGSITVLTGPLTVPTGAYAQIINTSTVANTATLKYAGTASVTSNFTGDISDSSGSGGSATALLITSGSLTLSGTNSYAGGTTINSGAMLTLSSTAGTSLPTGGNIANNGSLVVNDTIAAGNISGSGSTTVNSAMSLFAINFTQGAGLVNNGSTSVTGNGTVGGVSGTGSLTVGGTLQLSTNSGASSQGSLTINTGGDLDITNNSLIINYGANTDPKSTILGYLANGASAGAWNGASGIISSTAASNSKYGVGYADGADGIDTNLTSGQLEIAYVQYGDITLSGLVNANDFHILTSNFGKIVTGGWEDGDFFYSGTVNAEDFHLLTENFGQTENGEDIATPSEWTAIDAFAAANGLTVTPSVPEPASMGLMAVGAVALVRRRRRRIS